MADTLDGGLIFMSGVCQPLHRLGPNTVVTAGCLTGWRTQMGSWIQGQSKNITGPDLVYVDGHTCHPVNVKTERGTNSRRVIDG